VDLAALLLTLQLASATTAILLVIGLPTAYWLARSRWKGRFLVEALVGLPLVLPPTVVGFYFLLATGPETPIGQSYANLTGRQLPFSFAGILIASVLVNLPFAVRPFTVALADVPDRLLEAARCLGAGPVEVFWRVACRHAWTGILAGAVLSFAHVVGEFGVVLMVGGNIPGLTRTLSVAIYDDVQALDYASAHRTSVVLLIFAFVVMALASLLQRRTST
jgi:molybdate transport system permease protein